MRKNYFNFLMMCIITVSFVSCKKDTVDEVNFDVVSAKTTYKLSDTVQFNISGNPDVISFYSGETGNDYAFRNRTSRNDGVLKLGFQTRVDNTAGFAALASGALKVLVSTNFGASYSTLADPLLAASADSVMVNAATWTNISSRFTIPASGVAATFYSSGDATISDLITNPANPIYIAFKYDAPATASLGTNGITIGSLNMYNTFPNGSIVSYNLAPGGTVSTTWRVIKAANAANSWATSTTQLKFTSSATTAYSEDWAITNAFFPNAVSPDKSIPVKNIANNTVTAFKYKFSSPGTYNVFFVASNNRVYGQSEVVRQVILTVTP